MRTSPSCPLSSLWGTFLHCASLSPACLAPPGFMEPGRLPPCNLSLQRLCWPSLGERRAQDLCRETTQPPPSTSPLSCFCGPTPLVHQGSLPGRSLPPGLACICILIRQDCFVRTPFLLAGGAGGGLHVLSLRRGDLSGIILVGASLCLKQGSMSLHSSI